MNPVFYLLIISVVVFLWFVLAFLFKPIGRFFFRLWEDAKEAMEETDKKEN